MIIIKLKYVTDELKRHRDRKIAVSAIEEQIKTLEAEFTAIKATDYSRDIVSGCGDNIKEAKLIENIAKRTQLEQDYEVTVQQVNSVESTLDNLDPDERLVLTRFFINREQGAIQRLMHELNCEKSQVYRLKDKALIRFGTLRYGQIQL